MPADSRCVLTLAVGAPLYLDCAVNLARSFRWWHRTSATRFAIATDAPDRLPADLREWVEVVPLDRTCCGVGFRAKLYLDQLAPADRTLFVDADCLCVGNLESVFDRFARHAVGVVGGTIAEGEWFGNVANICEHFNVAALPKFNGGVYYFERGTTSSAVYEFARSLEKQYDELGLVRLRNQPNDELLLAIAMAVHRLAAIPDDGSILGDPQACPCNLSVNVLAGASRLVNPPPTNSHHQSWYPVGAIHPLLVHFLGHHVQSSLYRREAIKLELTVARHWPASLAQAAAAVYTAPAQMSNLARQVLRPAYHRLFGPRRIASDGRYVESTGSH
ncbi:MAG TPA: hypothetical protein VG713_05345 [Pirellulales bacterium]|nr:hypothetical protein [Pirellulales bacterium]